MTLSWIDWTIIIFFLTLILAIGFSYTQKAGKGLENFFLGGRNLPWWIAGTSMVATTFAADTPLLITEIVAQNGISGNWLWWNGLIGGMLAAFFFASLWRKANIVTDVELSELRYSGKPAKFLRGFKAIYLGVLMNAFIIAWVNVALGSILHIFFDIPQTEVIWYLAGAMFVVMLYSSLSGLLGVAITDFIQFLIAMTGTIILAVLVINSEQIGGIEGLKSQLPQNTFHFFPTLDFSGDVGSSTEFFAISLATFLAFVGFQWWASWYPGAEPGGGGYVAQRMMSAKNEKHAVRATLFFQIAHHAIRPLPWILVGLSAIVLYNLPNNIQDKNLAQEYQFLKSLEISDKVLSASEKEIAEMSKKDKNVHTNQAKIIAFNQKLWQAAQKDENLAKAMNYNQSTRNGYVLAMKDFLPIGLKGLLLVAFFAAYMSTISTQLNWGASYVINDFYKRFFKPESTDKQYVFASRIATLVLMLVALVVTTQISSMTEAFNFMIEASAGLGGVLILRWYWWRINAWAEIVATVFPFIALTISKFVLKLDFPDSLFFTASLTTLAWLVTTFLTQPENQETLQNFYQRVAPQGAWKPVRERLSLAKPSNKIPILLGAWISSIVMAYSILFTIGKLVFQEWGSAGIFGTVAFISWLILNRLMQNLKL